MYYVIINERYFPIRDEVLRAVRSDVLDAVHTGGAFITFEDVARQQTEVLVTGATPVRIERVEEADHDEVAASTAAATRHAQMTDTDWWLEWS